MNEQLRPPKWPIIPIRRILKKEFLEEIEGDMEEVFQDNLVHMSTAKAKRRFVWDCFKLIRLNLIERLDFYNRINTYVMLRNNLKIAFRILRKDKTFAAINILGLSVGLAIALLIIQYVKYEFSYESYNPNANQMVRITMDYMDGETLVEQDCETYPPLGPKISAEFSEVEDFTRAYNIDPLTIKVGENYFRENLMYATDKSFFRMFNYPLIQGNIESIFAKPNEVVLTENSAIKLFGTTDVVGERIEMNSHPFQVVGVISDPPSNTHLKFNILISYRTLIEFYDESDNNWNGNNTFTYFKLHDGVSFEQFDKRLAGFNKEILEQGLIRGERVIGQPMKDIHLYSHKSFEAEPNGDATTVFFLLGVAILVIIIAIVNYINLSTSKSLDRAKEVGIRKVLGSASIQLKGQFFAESFLINLFSGVLAILFMILLLGQFRTLADLPADFSFIGDQSFWFALVGILLLSTILSGIFPAIILTRFKPVTVLKGKFSNSGQGNLLRKSLVVTQFAITAFLLVQTLTANLQLNFMKEKDLGMNTDRVITAATPDDWTWEGFDAFKGELLNDSRIQSVTLSSCVPGLPTHQMSTTTGINPVDAMERRNNNFYIYFIDHEFLPSMGMELLAGNNFIDGSNENRIIVNEEALKVWGYPSMEDAIRKKIDIGEEPAEIHGVIKNFNQFSPKEPDIPMIFVYGFGYERISVKAAPGDPADQVAAFEKVFSRHFPETPFDYFFIDQKFDEQYKADRKFQQVFGTLTLFALLIAAMGLFGLASFTIAKRSKEIGIRKVLGASIPQLIGLVVKDFMVLVGVSLIISLPVTYWFVSNWLDNYSYRIDLSIWILLLPALIVLLVAFLSILSKTYRVSVTNPVNSLRDE